MMAMEAKRRTEDFLIVAVLRSVYKADQNFKQTIQ